MENEHDGEMPIVGNAILSHSEDFKYSELNIRSKQKIISFSGLANTKFIEIQKVIPKFEKNRAGIQDYPMSGTYLSLAAKISKLFNRYCGMKMHFNDNKSACLITFPAAENDCGFVVMPIRE